MTIDPKSILEALWWNGVESVKGFTAVSNALSEHRVETPDLIIAVGKAAGDMALGARAHFSLPVETLVVTKYDHVSDQLSALSNCEIIEAAHPIPDENSLKAGARILDAMRSLPERAKLLLLVSGGGSSLVEALHDGMTLDDLIKLNRGFMADGLTIGQINAKRKTFSKIKAGQLLDAFSGESATVIAISDVEGDSIDVIASGIGAYNGADNKVRIITAGSNQVARHAVAAKAAPIDIAHNAEDLYGDASAVAAHIITTIKNGPTGLYIFGGEPTVMLPENAGRGGRNQHLALQLANEIKGRNDITILVAGTDGSDGPTGDAGAIVDGQTVSGDIASYLDAADAGTYLAQRHVLLTTGPTGTNVMDLVLALKY